MTTSDPITVRHVPSAHRYEVLDGERVVGRSPYRPFDDPTGPQRIFFHTVVDDAYEGRGLGSRLAAFALRDTVDAGLRIVPVCPFITAYLGRHREFADHVVAVRPEHLRAVDRA